MNSMGEDYQKLKNIMDSLQNKMTLLVQENSKLNKTLIEYDSKFFESQKKAKVNDDMEN